MTFKIKTIIVFILLSIVPIGIISALVFSRGRQIIEQKTMVHLTTTNNLKSETLEQWIEGHSQNLETISRLIRVMRRKGAADRDWNPLKMETAEYPMLREHLFPFAIRHQFLELFVMDPDTGKVLFSTDPLQEGKFKDDQDFFLEGRKGPFVQDIVFDLASQKPVMFFARPLQDDSGKAYALLAGRADLSGLADAFEKRHLVNQTEDTYLVNTFNYFITEPRFGQGYALKKSLTAGEFEMAKGAGRFMGEYLNYQGVRVIGEIRWLKGIRLYLITEMAVSEAHAPVLRLKNQVVLIALVLALASALAGWILAAALTAPLTALMRAAKRVGQGQFKVSLETKKKGELYDLARSFAEMADSLEKTMVSKESLEKEVKVRRAAQIELTSTVKALEQSNQDLQQFAYVASHDLQEPLRMVSSFTQLLADRYEGALDEKAHRWIRFAVDGATRMQLLIQDLLSFSRVNTHGRSFEETGLDVAVTQALANLQLAVKESGAKVTVEPLPVVRADAGQMVMLFQNLISNSIKFCRDRRPEILISSEKGAGKWIIRVADNGIGIEPEFMEKIFVIFQRLHTREEYPGTGLGLAVCKRIVQRHGGGIRVTSQPDQGTVFHISLPA